MGLCPQCKVTPVILRGVASQEGRNDQCRVPQTVRVELQQTSSRPTDIITTNRYHHDQLISSRDQWVLEAVRMEQDAQLLRRNVKRFRGGLVFKAHRLLFDSTLGSRVITKKKRRRTMPAGEASGKLRDASPSAPSSAIRVLGLGFEVWGFGFWVWGFGFWV